MTAGGVIPEVLHESQPTEKERNSLRCSDKILRFDQNSTSEEFQEVYVEYMEESSIGVLQINQSPDIRRVRRMNMSEAHSSSIPTNSLQKDDSKLSF